MWQCAAAKPREIILQNSQGAMVQQYTCNYTCTCSKRHQIISETGSVGNIWNNFVTTLYKPLTPSHLLTGCTSSAYLTVLHTLLIQMIKNLPWPLPLPNWGIVWNAWMMLSSICGPGGKKNISWISRTFTGTKIVERHHSHTFQLGILSWCMMRAYRIPSGSLLE